MPNEKLILSRVQGLGLKINQKGDTNMFHEI